MENLRASKMNPEFDESQVLVASIHGRAQPFNAQPLPPTGTGLSCRSECDPRPSAGDTTCPEGYYCEHRGRRYACSTDSDCPDQEFCECADGSESCAQKSCFPASGRCRIPSSCASPLGISFSGDRYENFIKTFPQENYYPQPLPDAAEDAALKGWMCQGDFSPALKALGDLVRGEDASCITNRVLPCDGIDDTCPSFPYTDAPGECKPWPVATSQQATSEQYYCDSGIQLRIKLTVDVADPATELQETGYCIPESIGDAQFPKGCVVSPDKFSWIDCPSGGGGLKLQWANQVEAERALSDVEVQIRYTSISSSEE